MVNIFGPGHYGTTEEVADRPTPIATGKGFDAWFGQCNPDGTGGTAIDEQWLNLILAALRRSARSAGATENELSDDMLSEALSRYASGGIQYVDSGAANAYVLSTPNLFIMPKTYFKGMMIFFTPANPNNAASQVTVYSDGNPIPGGAKPILDQTGAALTGGELSSNLTGAHYDPALNGGNGAFKLFPWANAKTAHGYIGRRVFDSDAIYVPTPGTRRVRVKVIGGGAKGGDISAAASTQFAAAGGGGSGGEAESELASGYAGAAITIGLGGTTATPDGGTTSFGALLSATGGHSPLPLSPGTISQIQTGGAPGSGTGGNIRNSKGTSGLPGIAFSNTNEVSGAGAPSSDGPGGGSVFTSSSNGNDGAGYGTGGSGAVIQSGGSPVVGGKGKSGVVIIDEYS